MIEFLVTIILLLVVLYVINIVIGMLNLPANVKQIVYIIIGLIVLFWLLSYFGIYTLDLNGERPTLR